MDYVHQDHLTGTSVVSDANGNQLSAVSYQAYGESRNSQGVLGTDRLFTGQRLDGTGLYYYGARYYDPTIGRFISPDTVVQSLANPQALNRYSYVFNNPLKYVDLSGNIVEFEDKRYALARLEEGIEDELTDAWWELVQAYSKLMDSEEAGDIATALYYDPDKVVTIGFGNIKTGGQTLPTGLNSLGDFVGLVGDIVTGSPVDYSITMSSSLMGSPTLLPLLAHEVWHANDPYVSDSIEEELRAFRFADQVSIEQGLPYHSGLGRFNPDTLDGLRGARTELTRPDLNMPPFYQILPLFPASNAFDDLNFAVPQASWGITYRLLCSSSYEGINE